jgi:hemerythrin
MPFIEWENSFELGVEQFDEHHNHLVGLINKIYDGYTTDAPSEEVGVVLEKLIDYASYHFSAEELWMEKQKYPKLEPHVAEHEKFCHRVIGFWQDYNLGKTVLSLDVLTFLKDWLIDHILKTDSEYGMFIASRV